MNLLSGKLKLGCSIVALTSAIGITAATAQDAGSGDIEQVVVSASRISIAGYTAPTPVTVMAPAELEREANVSLGDSIRNLPSVGASSSPNNAGGSQSFSGGGAGLDTVNLRNLGLLRTLTLFDGQRVVMSSFGGGVDLSTIPTSLVQRVDVVTGGASAAWGSDAVAGVVNLILNKNFTGLKANAEYGNATSVAHESYKMEVSYGTDLFDGRGHVIVSGSYSDSPNNVFFGQLPWFNATYLVSNPAYVAGNSQPQLIHASNVGMSQETIGGLILSNPGTGAAANSLKGIQFVGPGATPSPFNYGNVTANQSNGGSANFANGIGPSEALADAYYTATLFGFARYRLTDSIGASLQLNFGQSRTFNTSDAGAASFTTNTILSGNPYIPASVQATMTTSGITSFTLGTTLTNNIDLTKYSLSAFTNSVGLPLGRTTRDFARGSFSLDGSIGDDWSWNAYFESSQVRSEELGLHILITSNLANALDAVTVTTANRGTSGLPVNSVTCRTTLTNPNNGCVPLNPFGIGNAAPGAINYINASPGAGNADYALYLLQETNAAASAQGTLPWGLPAGKIAVAFGAEYRHEGGNTLANPGGPLKAFSVGNYIPYEGEYYVYEGFTQVDAPILKDDVVQSLDFSMAGRMTSYSTSGLVETWKLGLTSQVTDDVRLRTTWSFDIRAPDIQELFSPGGVASAQAVDPKTGISVPVHTQTVGNPNLQPELATTVSGGVVLTPSFIDGLSLSADWYSISIKGAVTSVGGTTALAECNAGQAEYCAFQQYNGTAYPGALGTLLSSVLNAAAQTTSGLDFQGDYRMDLFGGNLGWHLLGNYTDEQTQFLPPAIGVNSDAAGSLGPNAVTAGFPKFRATLAATYSEGNWEGTVQGRFIGAAVLNHLWTDATAAGTNNPFVDNNDVPFVAYMDLRGSYKWTDNIQFYGAVDNVTNVPAPSVAGSAPASSNPWQAFTTIPSVYDAMGRSYRLGIRVTY